MHISVLKQEAIYYLDPKENENFVDCTAGAGGHTAEIIKHNGPSGRVLAFEWDKDLFKALEQKNIERVTVMNESYTLLEEVVEEQKLQPVMGVIFDLGFCSYHVDKSGRGFSFMSDERLDMRYNTDNPLTAHEIVNRYREKDLLTIIGKYGGEDFAEQIVREIVERRKEKEINTTMDLAEIIEDSVPAWYRKNDKINCATKTFQGLRITVNAELLGLRSALDQALNVLEKGGRMVVICFHSGEEDVLRSFIRKAPVQVLTDNPVRPGGEEVRSNIRSRSAKLYALIKL